MEVLNVDIKYAGYLDRSRIIEDIYFTLNNGEMVGIIGPNGAGKSTTIKAILGLLPVIEGDIQLGEQNKNYGYVPEQPILYNELTLWEHLEIAAAAFQMGRQIFMERSEELLKKFHLQEVKHHFPSNFSKGMQQKVMLILGFLIQPDVYIVDEPFIGLDPQGTKEFMSLLNTEKARGVGILLSTHQLDIAERICDSIVLVNNGKMVASGNIEQFRKYCNLPDGSLFDCFNLILENEA